MRLIILAILISLLTPLNSEAFSKKRLGVQRNVLVAKKRQVVILDTLLIKKVSKKQTTTNNPIVSRITFYDPNQDKWGDRVADPKIKKAKRGVTIAAHTDFPFGTKVKIPQLDGIIGDGVFTVQDRGGAVTKKKADYKYGKRKYVWDIFVDTSRERRNHTKNLPDYMEVIVL